MATYGDLTYGHGLDDKLDALQEVLPNLFDEDPISLVAAMLMLDQQFGLHQDDDYVLLAPGLLMWLAMMIKPVDEALTRAIEDEDEDALRRLTVENTFEALFESPEGPELTEQYPEIVRGKKIRLRVMTEEQSTKLSLLCTVRADGTFIYCPNPDARPQTIQDL